MKTPRLAVLAAQIEAAFPDLSAVVYPKGHPFGGYCNTDRMIRGTRLRHPGKGRRGSRLIVRVKATGCDVLNHNAAETYRRNSDVVAWIDSERKRRAT